MEDKVKELEKKLGNAFELIRLMQLRIEKLEKDDGSVENLRHITVKEKKVRYTG